MSEERCKCGSYAINPRLHGREEGVDLHLCDVCYWRTRSNPMAEKRIEELEFQIKGFQANYNDTGILVNGLRKRIEELEEAMGLIVYRYDNGEHKVIRRIATEAINAEGGSDE